MSKLKVAIIFGGCSEEHPISVKSAQEVARHLDPAKYEPFYVEITQDGAWNLCENGSSRPAVLSPDRSVHGLLVLEHGRYETISLDVVLPVLHGTLGEDGAIQGLLELSGIPYAGCDVQGSALCMDKSLTYMAARAAGIATPKFWAASTSIPTSSPIPCSSSRPVRVHRSASAKSLARKTCWERWSPQDSMTRRC